MHVILAILERFQDLRTEKGLTPEQLLAGAVISESALGKYETDEPKDISSFNGGRIKDEQVQLPAAFGADLPRGLPAAHAGPGDLR